MTALIHRLVPALLLLTGLITMAVSGLDDGGIGAYIGLPLFVIGFLWLLFPTCRRPK